VRTNRPTKAAAPRHRKPGPARLGGTDATGKRVREADADESVEDAEEGQPSWQQTGSAR
jgi:hypothetical protein